MTLNPARLARFADWAQTLPPRPLPRTVIPVPGEYYLDYISRLADANHLELLELTGALDDPAAVTLDPGQRKQHRQERLAAAAGQPLARIARLYWDDAGLYLRDPGGFRQMLRPACRRCTARLRHHRAHRLPPAAAPDRLPPPPALDRPGRPHPRRPARRQPAPRDPPGAAPPPRPAAPPPVAGRRGHHQRTPPAPSTRPCATAPGSPASGSACTSSPPAPGNRPWPACSAARPAGQTTAPATPSSRSRYTPTSSGSPHAASGSTAPATAPRPDAPASRPSAKWLRFSGRPPPATLQGPATQTEPPQISSLPVAQIQWQRTEGAFELRIQEVQKVSFDK